VAGKIKSEFAYVSGISFPLVVLISIVLIAFFIDDTFAIQRIIFGPFKFLGSSIATIGAVYLLWCVFLFLTIGRGTPVPVKPPQKLVIIGPYKYVRNPIYFSEILVLIGLSIYFGSISLLVLTFLAVVFFHLIVVFFEEKSLERKYGEEFLKYKKEVPRWIPRIKKLIEHAQQ